MTHAPCPSCSNGINATRVHRHGRAHYTCADCGRDVTLAMIYIYEAAETALLLDEAES